MRAIRIFSRLTLSTRLWLLVLIAFAVTALLRQNLLVRVRAAETYTVTNFNDSGPGSLRQAIIDANANAGTDVINFNLNPDFTSITPNSSLPVISDPVVIDGTTQPGFSGAPMIELSGFRVPNACLLNITAGGTTIRGLVINGFHECGIQLSTAGDNHIEGNYIGINREGIQGTISQGNGINVQTPDNFIGGTTPNSRNVISGINGYAISITGSANETQIQGNYIGTNAAGTAALNNASGIFLGTSNNTIGGTTPAARNLIAGGDNAGILMQVDGTSGNVIQGNYIGTDVTGMVSLGTGNYGIRIVGACSNNLIGGTSPEARNVISGNGLGLAIANGSGTPMNNLVQGNYIGVAVDGRTPLANRVDGIRLDGAVNTTIGGEVAGAGNIVAFNGPLGPQGRGIQVFGGNGNSIRGNSIFSNGRLGIDLDGGEVTPNDSGDPDSGGNNLQNFPVISSVSTNATQTMIGGSLNSTASTTFTIDFYANSICDFSGFGEGARWMGATTASTNSSGDASFNAAFAALPPNQIVTATATDPSGNTSEFSHCATTSPAVGSVGFSGTPFITESSGTVPIPISRNGGSAGSLTVGYTISGLTATAGSDFVASQGVVTFADGEVFKSLSVTIINDNVYESTPETLKVALSAVGDPDTLLAQSVDTLTIHDDDPVPNVSIGDVSAAEGNGSNFVFPLTLSNPSAQAINVTYGTSAFTAREGSDYLRANSLLVIPAGRTSASISVTVLNDTIAEGDEVFFLNLGMSFGAGIADGQGQGTILNDDGPPTSMTIFGRVTEFGGASVPNVTINLSLNRMGVIETQTTQTNISGNYTFANFPCADSATVSAVLAGRKFSPGSTTFVNTCGDQIANFLVVPAVVISQIYTSGGEPGAVYQGDYIELLNRGGPINLSNWSVQYAEANGSSWQTTPLPALTLQPGQRLLIREGSSGGAGAVVPSPDTSGGIELSSTAGKVALVGAPAALPAGPCPVSPFLIDFIGYGATANCFEGASAAPAPTTVAADRRSGDGCVDTDNNGADFSLGVPNPRNRFSAVNSCSSIFQFSSATYNVNEGDVFVTITVNRSGDTSGAAAVDFASSNGTATQTRDYEIASGTLSFAAGETSKTFRILIVNDAYNEVGGETVNLALSNPVGGVLNSPDRASLFIADNDDGSTGTPARQFIANLTSDQAVPPGNSNAKGGGVVLLNELLTSAKVSLIFSGTSGTGRTINGPAAPGQIGPQIFTLPTPAPVTNFVIHPSVQHLTDLRTGLLYIDVVDANEPANRIRGQLLWNPAEEAPFFVRQAYFDFLNRVPDAGGFAFWQGQITQCQSDVECLRRKRVEVSNAFFSEPEFQQTAAYVLRLYRAAYGNNQPFPNPNSNPGFPNEEKKLPSYDVFVADRARVIGGANLAQKQVELADLFVSRLEFAIRYPASLATADQFVDAVLATLQTDLGVNLSGQRANLINLYNGAGSMAGGRAAVMYRLADDNASNPIANQPLIDEEYNRSFVLGQYFGYLRRNPDIAGLIFWLGQVNGAPPRDLPKQQAMVCAFITSAEYQFRFGPVASRNNNECQ